MSDPGASSCCGPRALALCPALTHLLFGPLLPPLLGPLLPLGLALLLALSLGPGFGPRRAPLLRYTACACLLPPLYLRLRPALGLEPGLGLSWPLLLLSHAASALAHWALERPGPLVPPGARPESPGNPAQAQVQVWRRIARRLLTLSRPDLLPLSGAFVFLTLAVIAEMFLPYYMGKVIDLLGSRYDHQAFLIAIFLMFVTSMGSSISAGLRGGLFMFTMSRLNKRVRNQLFTSVVHQEIGFFEATRTGDISSRLSTDTTLMSRSIGLNVNVFLRSLVKTVGMLIFMFSLSWQLTLLMFIESPLTIVIQKLYNKYHMKLVQEVQDSIAKSNQLTGEIISAIRTVRSFATEDKESELYEEKLQETHELKNKRDIVRAVYLVCHRHIQLFMQIIMLYCGQYLIQTGQMSIGNLVAFILYQMNFGGYVRTLVHIYSEMTHSVGAAAKVFEYLDRKPSVHTDGKLVAETLKGHVMFQNVSFSYPTRPEIQVLKNVSFELKCGEITALVGPSGGGKTTCVSLLERFYQPQSGQILLDGKPIEEYEHKYYHNKLGLVGQEPVLFALSVQDNICYGLQNCPMTAITAAAQRANARGFIERMEHGYNTDVGEAGGQLSAGQKQRIAIARALVRQPQILILDEATSSLDVESEHTIQQALSRDMGKTILVIAHRLKTVEKADKIIVIENGSVMEQGSHQELMQQEGCYFRLVQRLFTNGEQDSTESEGLRERD
ncbi:antigen peptide transporter 2-like [Heterodontus francisci]|uniref:Transporter associated with antigen processing 2 n=1 Tax=Heterodontus francisci TaxID=7792 RepID=Q9PVE7_HETFR|nr:transporter associated with antigen processing 2 [Heterodontus francisci]